MRHRTALLLSSVIALSCPSSVWAKKHVNPVFQLSALSSMRIGVNSIDTEPINGFIPQIVEGLTNEQDDDNDYSGVEGIGIQSSSPGGLTLPTTGAPFYTIATLDSGSSGDIISYNSSLVFDLPDAGLIDSGSQLTTISGASGDEDVTITNALGVYATDLSHASVTGGTLTAASGSLQGQYNVPVLVGNQGDGLPDIVGSPILSMYRATIQNSQPQHLTVGGVTYQTPKVTLGAFSSTIPAGYSKLTLKAFDSASGSTETEPAPYYYNFELNGPKDPDIPGVWGSFFTNGGVGLSDNGTTASGQTFLLDTGAQVSVISYDEAALLGIFNVSPTTSDFTEQVQGVGGITEVPGYYISSLTLLTQQGVLSWNRVPVLVLDVADPRDPTSNLPGILGTDLFSDRDLILNTNVSTNGQTYLAIGPQMQWQQSGGGLWSNASNWAVVLPNGVDLQANFYGSITAPSTINVDGVNTVGRITFDNANRYTLSGAGSIILNDSGDQSQINVRTGSHTIAVPVSLASDTIITVIPTTSTLTMSGVISSVSGQGITESGYGTLLLTASNTYTGATNVSTGTLTVTGSIAGSTAVSTAIGATLNAAGAINAGLSKSTVLISDGVVKIGPNAGVTGPASVTVASIEVGSDPTSQVAVLSSPLQANCTVLVTSGLSFDSPSAGQLDLKNNDIIIHGSTLAAVLPSVMSGLNQSAGGYWNGPGIVSSTAASDSTFLTTLAVVQNITNAGTPLFTLFISGQPTTTSDILIKYTYYGDSNLDGRVDGSDYTLIDHGYLTHLTGWYNGDYNYDGKIDGSDYTLIDNAFNTQGARLTGTVASSTSELASAAVPEPASAGLLLLAVPLVARRRRSRPVF